MSFLQSIGTENICQQLGIHAEEGAELIGKCILIDQKKLAALFPIPTKVTHDNYPPIITFRFFLYNTSFKVKHSWRYTGKKSRTTIEVFIIEIDRNFSTFKRRRIEALCREAISCYLGSAYWGRPYEVTFKLIPMSKKELARVEKISAQVIADMEKAGWHR